MSVEIKIDRALDWQRSNAAQLKALIASKQAWYDENVTGFISDWFTDVFNLDTANDFGLAVWSVILDEPLYDYYVGSSEDYPAFGFGSAFKNFGRGNFASNTATTVSFSTEEKRQILKLKAYILHMSGNVADINAALASIFGTGIMWAENNLDMSMTYYVAESFDIDFAGELRDRDLLPRPTTVKIDGVNVYYETPFIDFAAAYSETESAVVLTWTEVSDDVTGVTVYRDTSEIDTSALPTAYGAVSAGVETFIDDSFDSETVYYYLIDVQTSNRSFYSENASATTPAPAEWTPAEVTTALWLDAGDSDTVTLDGSEVTQVGDKSGNGRDAYVPAYISAGPGLGTLNGLGTLVFTGTNQTLSFDADLDLLDKGVFTVARHGDNDEGILLSHDVDNVQLRFSSSHAVQAVGSPTLWGNAATSSNLTIDTDYVIGFLGSSSGATVYIDGELSGSTGSAQVSSVNVSQLGLRDSNSESLTGVIAEVVVTDTVPSTATRQKIEGYLAWKWGLTDSLPTDHPYKTTAPTV